MLTILEREVCDEDDNLAKSRSNVGGRTIKQVLAETLGLLEKHILHEPSSNCRRLTEMEIKGVVPLECRSPRNGKYS